MARVDSDYTDDLNFKQEQDVNTYPSYTEEEKRAIAAIILLQNGIIQQ